MYQNFINDFNTDNLAIDSIDAYIEYWHNHVTNQSLREFLGFTPFEYETWLKAGNSVINDILYCRKQQCNFEAYYAGK